MLLLDAGESAVALRAAVDERFLFHEGAVFGALLAAIEASVGHGARLHPDGEFAGVIELAQIHFSPSLISVTYNTVLIIICQFLLHVDGGV